MKKGFPKTILGFPIGWKKLGKVKENYLVENEDTIIKTDICTFCRSRIKIGKENNELFKYCPKCLTKKNN